MQRFAKILLCVDVEAEGFDAEGGVPPELESAIAEANWVREQSGGQVTVMTVLRGAETEPDLLDLAQVRLQSAVVPRVDGEVTVVVLAGNPFVEVIRHVVRNGTDLVVVGARKLSLVHRTLVGSTVKHLLNKCPCPVWVAPRRSEPGPRVVLSAVALHELTPLVLELSASVVARRGGRWNVFHCPEYPHEGGMRLRNAPLDQLEAYEHEVRQAAWKELHRHCDPLAESTGVTPKLWMSEGLPSEQISLALRELQADVLVMGSVGHSGLVGTVIGSTAERVFNSTECSILTVKPTGFVTPVDLDG